MKVPISITINGKVFHHEVEGRELLVYHLRDKLRLTGTHIGCDTSSCGACTVHIDGDAVKSCTVLVAQCDGASIRQSKAWQVQTALCTPSKKVSAKNTACNVAFAHPVWLWLPPTFWHAMTNRLNTKFGKHLKAISAVAQAITTSFGQFNTLLDRLQKKFVLLKSLKFELRT